MTLHDLAAILPLLVLAAAGVVVMVVAAFRRSHGLAAALSAAGLAAALFAICISHRVASREVAGLVLVDPLTMFFWALILVASLASTLLMHGYFQRCSGHREELYILMLLAALGAMVLIASDNFVSFFLGLEILSISLFAMIAYRRETAAGAEAAVKYLVLGGASSAFLVFGMALVYFETGTLRFVAVDFAAGTDPAAGVAALGGLAMIVIAAGFKLSLAPFHMWVADVYEGAPAPVTAFLATVSKGSMVALILRFFAIVDLQANGRLVFLLALIALASMFVGNYLALAQNNIKRMLAYSSVAHTGYLLVALLAGGPQAPVALAFYLVAYFVTTLGAFGSVSLLSGGAGEAASLEELKGLAWRRPWLGAGFTISLLSLAGIPLTAGFLGKVYLVLAGLESGLRVLVIALVVNSALGLFYYLRAVAAIYGPAASSHAPARGVATENLAMVVIAIGVVWLGVDPSSLIHIIQSAVAGFL